MKPFRIAVGVLALAVAGCGGTTATVTTSTIAQSSTTEATTTTAAPVTTVAETTTTIPADMHPEFRIRWEDVWPAAALTAVYRITTFGGEVLDLPAHMEYGVDFAGGTFDRLVVGTPEPGNDAMVVYFDRSEPWEIAVVGEEVFSAARLDRADSVYVFAEPMAFNGLTPIGETEFSEGRLALTLSTGDVLDLGVTYEVTPRSIETVTVPAGDFDDVLVIDVVVGGELLGGDFTFPLEIWLDAANLFVAYTGASGFDQLELLESWG